MANVITRFFDKLMGRKPDTRPDPEDAIAYSHTDKVAAKQAERFFPTQTLKSGKIAGTEEAAPWEPSDPNYTCWVDVYESPAGIGYVVNYEYEKGMKTFRKSINYGPESHREQDWAEVQPLQFPNDKI